MSNEKFQAAIKALDFIEENTVLGVGTGSTVDIMIHAMHERNIKLKACVSSSKKTSDLLTKLGYRVKSLDDYPVLDLYIDGADEINNEFSGNELWCSLF